MLDIEALKIYKERAEELEQEMFGEINDFYNQIKEGQTTGNPVIDQIFLMFKPKDGSGLLRIFKEIEKIDDLRKILEDSRGKEIHTSYATIGSMIHSGGIRGPAKHNDAVCYEWGTAVEEGNVLLVEENKFPYGRIRINTGGIHFKRTEELLKKSAIEEIKGNLAYDPGRKYNTK